MGQCIKKGAEIQLNSVNTYNYSGRERKPQTTFDFADPKGGLKKVSIGISASGPARENDVKDAFSRLDTQKPVKKIGIKNSLREYLKDNLFSDTEFFKNSV